jgi:hypothetical protein
VRRFLLITAVFALALASGCQSPPPPWESEAPGASAAEYLDSLPYDFHPGTDVCPTEAQLREAFPATPAITEVETEVFTEALDTAVTVIDNGDAPGEDLEGVASGVECFFHYGEIDFLKIAFGVYPFPDGAEDWYTDASGSTEYPLPEWDRASFTYSKNATDASAPGALDDVRFAAIRGQAVVYGGGGLANDGMTEDATAEALIALAAVNAGSLWER